MNLGFERCFKRCGIVLLCLTAVVFCSMQPVYADEGTSGAWEFSAGLYAWTPSVKGETALGTDIDVSFNDIIDNLDITLMAMLTARKDKFSLLVDVIYMDIEDDSDYALISGPRNNFSISLTNVEMEAWVVTPAAAYTVVDSDRLKLDLLAGARYLYIETEIKLRAQGPLTIRETSPSESNHVWDGIIGARGDIKLNEQWALPFHFDVGTGETDLTWQAFGGVGYKFSNVDLIAGYRHLEWDFDDSDTGGNLFNDLYISGPVVGLRYFF
jgi:opacity protein-like surface antigen